MAICRFSPKSDVFIDFGEEGHVECIACRLDGRSTHHPSDKKALINHLNDHIAAGHKVPETIFEDLDLVSW